ncbi:expressed unknown protein [Seminavis robusta]|uniref:Uncharacterized protein n=1 Tax=Seminavis robusta TaxID=568900 RepID=A0A9N8HEY2_9STRA|nr:expressed unknown protein [Seminavis robusta]|eukprot:Sro539_g162790.1 n/a (113) ;mRNA; f:12827-13448
MHDDDHDGIESPTFTCLEMCIYGWTLARTAVWLNGSRVILRWFLCGLVRTHAMFQHRSAPWPLTKVSVVFQSHQRHTGNYTGGSTGASSKSRLPVLLVVWVGRLAPWHCGLG